MSLVVVEQSCCLAGKVSIDGIDFVEQTVTLLLLVAELGILVPVKFAAKAQMVDGTVFELVEVVEQKCFALVQTSVKLVGKWTKIL